MQINLILAVDLSDGIGKNNSIPWNLKNDLKYFKKNTSYGNDNAVIMGRKTWESIPQKNRPLKNRLNIIVSTKYDIEKKKNIINTDSIQNALCLCKKEQINKCWIIGGKSIYEYFLKEKLYDLIYITRIFNNFDCDTKVDFLNEYLSQTVIIAKTNLKIENKTKYQHFIYGNPNYLQISQLNKVNYLKDLKFYIHPDMVYLNVIKEILEDGNTRKTRNGETISSFGKRLELDLKEGLPLLTSKKIYWKGILHELQWFINSDTNSKNLEEKNVNIWKGNTDTSYLEKLNLPYEEGIGGPIYGWQWRKFNQEYLFKNNETGIFEKTIGSKNGFDQLQFIIDEIKNDPKSRRLFMSAWNPCQMDQMCLPPCHVSYQFYVSEEGLSCQMYQRSADVFLGLPFNIASTATLTLLIAHHCGLEVDKMIICIGDAHIYTEHLEAIKQQLFLDKPIYKLPKLEISKIYDNINDYKYEDFLLTDYESNPAIKAKMLS